MVYKEAGIDDIVRGLTRSGWFCSVYEGRLPGTGQVRRLLCYLCEIAHLHFPIGCCGTGHATKQTGISYSSQTGGSQVLTEGIMPVGQACNRFQPSFAV
ncbi:hypothetical protein Tco_1377252 [Tanacetum coccineum]